MNSVTSNAVAKAIFGKMNVIYKKATTDLSADVQNILDFIKANRTEFVPNGRDGIANYLILENNSGGGCHNVLVGSTNSDYFIIVILSFYYPVLAYRYQVNSDVWLKISFG